ncbi:MAG: hypothetical protein LBB21_00760 [Holosporaceae bacterium]|jgi:hypothetical protein|nr:hypothetical protein [Holosporaceae bacterium]
MTLTRGIRALSAGYYRDFSDVPDTDENLSTCIVLESNNDDCCASLANSWPDSIALDASMSPVEITSRAVLERIENRDLLGRIAIYDDPKFDVQSHIQNVKSCCSEIVINFENTGKYVLGNSTLAFFGKNFDDYQLDFQSDHLFKKEFVVCRGSIQEIANEKGFLQHENSFTECKIYPYGGLFGYGMHPKQMESCIFRTVMDGRSPGLRISPLSALRSLGIDPTEDQRQEVGYKFVGVKNFSESQKINLYDELKNGFCKIEVTNRNINEKSMYKSNGIFHMPKTNLITINFIPV